MTYSPAKLAELAAFWVRQGGVNLGIVGDAAHAARPTYHNGWDRAVSRYGTTSMSVVASRDYSFRLARDQVKSNAAMGLDLGKLDGSLGELRKFSIWLKDQCKAGAPGTADIREVIYSPDGKVVKRWDNVAKVLRDGYPNATGQGDSSHLWHTHISFFRDSEARSKLGLFTPYFSEDNMPISLFETPRKARLKADAVLYADPALTEVAWKDLDQKNPDGSIRWFFYPGTLGNGVAVLGYEPSGGDADTRSPAVYTKTTSIEGSVAYQNTVEKVVEVPTGITQEQVDAAAAAARATGLREGGTIVAAAATKAAQNL